MHRTLAHPQELLLTERDMPPGFGMVPGSAGKRVKEEYTLEDEEWEEFEWQDGYKIAFQNREDVDESYRIIYSWNTIYGRNDLEFPEYKEHTLGSCTAIDAPKIGDDSFVYRCDTMWEGRSWSEYQITFIRWDVYENVAIRGLSSSTTQEETVPEILRMARVLDKKIIGFGARPREDWKALLNRPK